MFVFNILDKESYNGSLISLLTLLSPLTIIVCNSACLVQRSGWTRDMDLLFHWLSAIPFSGGGFSEAAIAEGLAEALMVS